MLIFHSSAQKVCTKMLKEAYISINNCETSSMVNCCQFSAALSALERVLQEFMLANQISYGNNRAIRVFFLFFFKSTISHKFKWLKVGVVRSAIAF